MESVILCRFGELFLKAGNRRAFVRILADNVRAAIAELPRARVEPTHGRLLVRLPADDANEAAGRLQRVFGLVSVSIEIGRASCRERVEIWVAAGPIKRMARGGQVWSVGRHR